MYICNVLKMKIMYNIIITVIVISWQESNFGYTSR